MELTQEIKQKIKNSIVSTSQESCGLIVTVNDTYNIYPCKNVSLNPQHHFSLSPLDYLRASELGKIIACYHSHVGPKVEFSMFDKIQSSLHQLPYILYHVPTNAFFHVNPDNAIGLLGRTFELGKTDCFTLVKDYYQQEFNISLHDINRQENWYLEWHKDKILEYGKQNNFVYEEDVKQAQKHDILGFDWIKSGHIAHFAVYLGNGYILHHPRNGDSQITLLTRRMYDSILFFGRHISQMTDFFV